MASQNSTIDPSMLRSMKESGLDPVVTRSPGRVRVPIKTPPHAISPQSHNRPSRCRAVCLDSVVERVTGPTTWAADETGVWATPIRKTHPTDDSSVKNDAQTNNERLKKLCSRGDLLGASRLVGLMTRGGQIPHFPSCVNLIRGLVKAHDDVNRAHNVLKRMVLSGGVPDVITYNMLVGGLCKKRRIDAALDVLDGMDPSGCPPDVITYNAILRVMFEHGYVDEAVGFWKAQLAKGCPPYIVTGTVLVELVCKARGVIRALRVLEDLDIIDIVAYNAMVNVASKRGDFGDASLVVGHLVARGLEPNTVTYNTLLHSFCNHGYLDEVDETLSVMNETPHPPTVVTYNILINGFCKNGRVDRAIGFLDAMVARGVSPDIITYNTLLRAVCDEGLAEEAIEVLACLCEPSLITYNIVIDGLAKTGQMEKAVGLYRQMTNGNTVPDDITHRCLIGGFCQADMVEEAVETLKVMEKNRHQVTHNTYRYVINRLCRDRKLDVAIEVLKMMVSGPNGPRETFVLNMLRGLDTAGMHEEVTVLHDKLVEWNVV